MTKVSKLLELVHVDQCGPFRTRSWHGKRYITTITVQFTKSKLGIFLRDKKGVVKQDERWSTKTQSDQDIHDNYIIS